jgi:hypothetical protein
MEVMHMCSAARRQQARMQAPRLSVHLSLVYLRMRMYVSGRYVEQGVHMRVQQFLGWVGIFTGGTTGVFLHASVMSVFGCASCRPDD